MRPWLACALLVALCARIGWIERRNRHAVEITALTAITAVGLTVLR